jgi:uncharacterized repeat protein (TIGR01451 family)
VDEGRAYVYHGSSSGLASNPDWVADGGQAGAALGSVVGTAGDVNGDGFGEVIVGAPLFDADRVDAGRAVVYRGSVTGLASSASWSSEGAARDVQLGAAVDTAGDVNGDGLADVVVGTRTNEAFVHHGAAAGLSISPIWTASDTQGCFGCDLGAAGDVNADGYADLIVGQAGYSDGETDEGRAMLYFGNDGIGLSLNPQQRRADDTGVISPATASDGRDSFRLQLAGRGPFGRGQVKLEWEVKPLGTPFDGAGTQTSTAWTDSGTAGTEVNELVSGLSSFTAYHWRVRLLYHQATTPSQQHSRWLTVPRNGWHESDLRTPRETQLTVAQSDSGDPILAGANVVYTVQLTNNGPDAGDIVLRDELPAATFVSATPTQGSCNMAGPTIVCSLGVVPSGGAIDIAVEVESSGGSMPNMTNTAWVSSSNGRDSDPSDNVSSEATSVLVPAIGDRVWADDNRNGLQDIGELGMADVLVALFDGTGNPVASTFTDGNGDYSFSGLTFGADYFAQFVPPAGFLLTSSDQGVDDTMDSDADPVTRETPTVSLVEVGDRSRWDAGTIPACVVPDQPLTISLVELTTDGNDFPIFHFGDPNTTYSVTGYNVYRSQDASLPPTSWILVASDVIDMDEGTAENQWVDTSAAVSPSGIFYYQIVPYNSRCPAEGPR